MKILYLKYVYLLKKIVSILRNIMIYNKTILFKLYIIKKTNTIIIFRKGLN